MINKRVIGFQIKETILENDSRLWIDVMGTLEVMVHQISAHVAATAITVP